MTIDRKNTKISAGGDVLSKEKIDHVLGNHKGARDHLVSRFLFTLNELLGRMLRQDFFELRALRGQKDHNNLLPPVKFSWNHVCFGPGNILMAAIIISTHKKSCSRAHF